MQFLIFAAVFLCLIPGSWGNHRARAFYALTNHPANDQVLEPLSIIDPNSQMFEQEQALEPLVLLQNSGNDPRCIFCRSGLGKRMSVEIKDSGFRRHA